MANVKNAAALANQLPAGSAGTDLDLLVDPDTANFTGSITFELHYDLSDSTP